MVTIVRFLSFLLVPASAAALAAKPKKVGGQAVIEGVMMRGREKVSLAVRKLCGEMVIENVPFTPASKKSRLWRFPILRGAANLYESLVIGYKALSRSAEIAMQDERESKGQDTNRSSHTVGDTIASWASLSLALIISIGLFMYAPMWILSRLVPEDSAILFNMLAGIIRITLFLAYLILISQWKDMRRVFEYHGAEHKAIFTFEDGKDLTLDNMRPYTTLHPRCGTSFLLLVALICILLFSIVDALYIQFIGPYHMVAVRLAVHLALIPLVGGTSYELLKVSDRYRRLPVVGAFIMPGLWLQKITTKEPDDTQLEVAAVALKAAL
ncbi:MAG: DUF1385 domain-containing protein [Chitinispirillaceae bacterium]|nr:DUF1385 domain-containing protein [Chitinispirillaceae bacterium]